MIVGVGIDLVDIARVKRLIASKGERALGRLFTDREREYANRKTHPYVHLAARVAAKEATFKALAGNERARGIAWREMEVVVADDGRPFMRLHGSAVERAEELGVVRVWLTLSHSEMTAGAVCIAESRE